MGDGTGTRTGKTTGTTTGKGTGATGREALGILKNCSGSDLARLRAAADEVTVAPGDELWRQGTVAVAAVWVQDGRADTSIDGRRRPAAGPGALLGVVDVLDRRPHRETVVAATPMTVWRIDADGLDRLLLAEPTFARALLRHLSRRLRVAELASQPA